ncbi:MAG: DNA-binding response regulator [Bacteroidetes bacterium]|nr:MAG: DNA-binding response regulator [Bacteroidota bacterium]
MASTKKTILIVDDDEDILELLFYNLKSDGYHVEIAKDGVEAIEVAKKTLPELIIMDIMMPKMDGVEACRNIRQIPDLVNTHIIFLTARVEEYSEIAAFDSGADDYIMKPIKPRALMSRVTAHFKKSDRSSDDMNLLEFGDLKINRVSYTVSKGENLIELPKKEFELLYFLAKKPGQVFNRDVLLKNIWGTDVYVLARTVDVHVRKVREKIGDKYIKTVMGVGYKFEPPT